MRHQPAGSTGAVLAVLYLCAAPLWAAAPDYQTAGYQASESQPAAMLAVNGHLLVAAGGTVTSYFVTPHSGEFEPRSQASYPDGGLVAIAQCSGELVLASGGTLYTFGVDRTTGTVTPRQSSPHAGGSAAALALVSGHLIVAGAGVVQAWMVEGGSGQLTPQGTAPYADLGEASITPAGGHLVVCSGERLTVYRVLAGAGQVAKLSETAVLGAAGQVTRVRPAGGMLIAASGNGAVSSYGVDPTDGQLHPGQTFKLPGTGAFDLGYSTGNLILARGGTLTSALVTGQQVAFRQQAPSPETTRVALALCNGNLIVGNRNELRSYLVDGNGLITPRARTPLGGAPAGKPLQLDAIKTRLVVPPGFEPNWDADSLTLSMKGTVNGLGLLLTASKESFNEQELAQFAEQFMGAIGEAMGVTNFTAKASDTMEIGGRPALLRMSEGEKQEVKASFTFLFFSTPEFVYACAYVVPAEKYDEYLPSFLSFLESLDVKD